jgi:hypothetical protein
LAGKQEGTNLIPSEPAQSIVIKEHPVAYLHTPSRGRGGAAIYWRWNRFLIDVFTRIPIITPL